MVRAVAEGHGITPENALPRQSDRAFKHTVYLLRRLANLSSREAVAQIQSEIEAAEIDQDRRKIVAKLKYRPEHPAGNCKREFGLAHLVVALMLEHRPDHPHQLSSERSNSLVVRALPCARFLS